jgi:hypothetical protein
MHDQPVADVDLHADSLVADLEQIGIRFLSRTSTVSPIKPRLPDELLVQLIHQSDSRLRNAIIAVFFIQQLYLNGLRPFIQKNWRDLENLYSAELLPSLAVSPEENLKRLGQVHQQQTGKIANWPGTYDNVARHLIHQLQLDAQWSR